LTGPVINVQDNDPKHKSKLVQNWINERVDCLEWPPYSPDLNPIENLWADVKRRAEMDNPKTKEELEAALRKSWSEIDARLIKKLIKSMPKRCKLVLEKGGWMTGY
jgi:transposase